MKVFLPFFLLCLSFLASPQAKAQFVLNVVVVDASSPAACDGYAMIDSGYANFAITWYMNGVSIQNGNVVISNLCPGNYSVTAMGNGMVVTSPFTIGVSTVNPCAGFGVSISSTPTSNQTACDGTLTASVYGGSAPYTYAWNNGGVTTTQNATNLCVGTYTLTVTDANGCNATENATVFYDTSVFNPCAGFTPVVTVTDLSAPGACDGAVSISCSTCAPFWVAWSQGSSTFSITNLCEGNYAAVVTDANGCTFSTTQFVTYNGSGTIDSINVVGTLATGANITGTLTSSWIYNCDIDMSMLDTAYMVSATFGNNPANQDSLYTVWYLSDTTGAFTYINYTYYVPNAIGIYNLVLSVYCPIKSTPIYYQIISQFDVLTAGIVANNPISLTLAPNPVQDLISVSGLENGQYAIYNQAGQVLLAGDFNKAIDVRKLANGTYFLHLNGQVLPFIKTAQ